MVIYIGYNPATGRPLGFASSPGADTATRNWPGQGVIQYQGEGTPDLSSLWVEDGILVNRIDQGADEDLVNAVKAARRALADQVNGFINTKTQAEGSGNRYDSGFKITTVNLKIEYRAALAAGGLTAEEEAAINAKLDRIGELETWINAVMGEYQAKVVSVLAAATIEEARAVTLDLDKFRIGATGDGALPDPDVYLSEIA